MENGSENVVLQVRDSAFNRRIRTFAIVNKVQHIDIEAFLKDAFYIYRTELTRTLEERNMVKTMTIFVAEFQKIIPRANENENSTPDDSASGSGNNKTNIIFHNYK